MCLFLGVPGIFDFNFVVLSYVFCSPPHLLDWKYVVSHPRTHYNFALVPVKVVKAPERERTGQTVAGVKKKHEPVDPFAHRSSANHSP